MREKIQEMANKNIGALCLFLNNERNKDYLNEVLENIPKEAHELVMSEKIAYYVNQKKTIELCDCGEMKKFMGFKHGWRQTCGRKKCVKASRKNTCLDKYGVDNPQKSPDIISKKQERILEKWGGEHYMKNDMVQLKFKTTMIEKHGVEWAQQSKEINEKSQDTWKNNPKKEEILKTRAESIKEAYEKNSQVINKKRNDTIIKNWGSKKKLIEHRNEKIKENSLKNFNCEHHLSDPNIIKKRVNSYIENKINKIIEDLPNHIRFISREYNENQTDQNIILYCSECNKESKITRQYLKFRTDLNNTPCLNCLPILSGRSNLELEVLDHIKEIYHKEIITNTKSVIEGELDIYLPDENIAFEFNGLYWHSELHKDKNYHLNKTKMCAERGIELVHIFEDDWRFKKDIIMSIIKNKLGISKRIFARNCQVEIMTDNKVIRNFLTANHIQGFVGSKFKIGLKYKGELVSLMTFGSLRKPLNSKGGSDEWELLRFCNKLGIQVVGGASRSLKNFIREKSPNTIISYSDSSRSNGKMYDTLGFTFLSDTPPNYYWVIDGVRKHRFNYRKDKLVKEGADSELTEVEIMNQRGYYRIFDCGSKKWSLTL